MALVSNKTNVATQTAAGTADKTIDIFGADAPTGKASKINPEEDAWISFGPPPMGVYSLQLFLSEQPNKGVKPNYDRQGNFESYSINFSFKIVNSGIEEYDGVMAFGTVTTRIGRGKEISTAAGLFLKMGHKLDPNKEYNDLKIAQLLIKALERSPILHGNECDWKASYKYTDKNGKDQWVNVANSMTEFPMDDEGKHKWRYSNTNRVTGEQVEIKAQFVVKKWGGKEVVKVETTEVEEVQEVKPAAKVNGKPAVVTAKKKAPEPEPEVEEEEIEVSAEDEELALT